MLIPLIKKDPAATDFNCRDGEIEFQTGISATGGDPTDAPTHTPGDITSISSTTGYGVRFRLTPEGDFPTANIRIPLQSGDAEKAALMMQGQISRVDASTADRLTDLMVKKAADVFSRLVIDRRRSGLQLLPFRVFTRIRRPDGSLRHPSAMAVMLPSEYPPHPEIAAHAIADDTLNLNLRFPVKAHRMQAVAPTGLKEGYGVNVYVSYPLYLPDKEEAIGSLGSVRSVLGGNSLGIRFAFLSESRLKYSVAAPEKYYQLTGNENTGYHMSSKAVALPDYSEYADDYGYVPPFPADCLRQEGSQADPMQWIADWQRHGSGYLPESLPYILRSVSAAEEVIPEGIDSEFINSLVETTGYRHVLLTRPMTFATAEKSRRKAGAKGVERMRIHGLADAPCLAVLLGSNDGTNYTSLRRFNPHATTLLLSPPRLFHRLLLLSNAPFGSLAIEI